MTLRSFELYSILVACDLKVEAIIKIDKMIYENSIQKANLKKSGTTNSFHTLKHNTD